MNDGTYVQRRHGASRAAAWWSTRGPCCRVADQLEVLAAATGADELLLTTITHDHADRVRSYELIAQEWSIRRPSLTSANGTAPSRAADAPRSRSAGARLRRT